MFFNIFINSLHEVVNSEAARAPDKIVLGQLQAGEAGQAQKGRQPAHAKPAVLCSLSPAVRKRGRDA